jgi:predicted ribosome quality control (RQC) complex YloA/Tae2 family protein
MKDVKLLKIGRHFRFGKNKIIVGRNETENKQLLNLKHFDDYTFEVSEFNGPITILQGSKTKETVEKTARLTVRYSDAKGEALVKFGRKKLNKTIIVSPIDEKEIEKLRIKY